MKTMTAKSPFPVDEHGLTAADHMQIASALDRCADRTTDRVALDRSVGASLCKARALRPVAIAGLVLSLLFGTAGKARADGDGTWLFDAYTEDDLATREGDADCPKDDPSCTVYVAAWSAWDWLVARCDGWSGGTCVVDDDNSTVGPTTPLVVTCEHYGNTCGYDRDGICQTGHPAQDCCWVSSDIWGFPYLGYDDSEYCCTSPNHCRQGMYMGLIS